MLEKRLAARLTAEKPAQRTHARQPGEPSNVKSCCARSESAVQAAEQRRVSTAQRNVRCRLFGRPTFQEAVVGEPARRLRFRKPYLLKADLNSARKTPESRETAAAARGRARHCAHYRKSASRFWATARRNRRVQSRIRPRHACRTRRHRAAPRWKNGGGGRRRTSARKVANAAPSPRLQARGAMRAFDGDSRVVVSELLSGARNRVVPTVWEVKVRVEDAMRKSVQRDFGNRRLRLPKS